MSSCRTCAERGGAVRSALVIGDLDHVEYDYIITVLLNASVRDLQRYVDASNHSLLDELLDDLGETSRKIFVFCNVPQHDRLYIRIQRVQNSCTRGILRLNLTSLAYNRYGLGTRRPKGRA